MKPNWAARLFTVLARHRLVLAAVVIAVMGVCLLVITSLELDMSLKALMPDSSAASRRSAELLDLAPFSRVILVQLTALDSQTAPRLAQAADDLVAGLNPARAQKIETARLPDFKLIMALLPALCDNACLSRLRQSLTQPQMEEAMASIKLELAGAGGLGDLLWRLDPLTLRSEIFSKFPRRQGWPLADPLIGYPISPDGRHLLIILKPLVSMNDPEGAKTLMADFGRLTGQLPEGVSAQVVGAQRHTAANAAAIERDLTLTMSLALLLILAIYLFMVRSWGSVWLFLTPAVAVMAATVGLTMAFPQVSGLALGFGAAVLGIAEDYAVHVHYALRRAISPQAALSQVARPLVMSAVTCVVGFGVLLFSAVPAIRQLAFFSSLAIAVGYLWAVLVLPHCPAMDRPREVSRPFPASSDSIGRVKMVWPVFLGLVGLTVALMSRLPVEISVRAMGLSSPAIVEDQRLVEETWRLEGGRRIYLVRGDPSGETSMDLSGRLTEALNGQVPGSASSLAGLLPPLDAQRANLEGWRDFLAEDGCEARRRLTRVGEAAGFASDAFTPFWDWFFSEGSIITPNALTQAGLGQLVDNFIVDDPQNIRLGVVVAEPDAPEPPPNMADQVFSISVADLERDMSQALAGEKRLLPFCVLICLGVLVWALRGVSLACLAFIPALSGLLAVQMVQLIMGRPLGLVEVAALPLVICLGADYGIVAVSEMMANADLGAPKAIVVSGLSTIAGVGILILASHPVLSALGRTVFIGLMAAMPVSIMILPKMFIPVKGSNDAE
ncbi:MAG: MMPL family transporter [Deltaproteobacteria bacterium]|jgi:predicted exporter|nr:MMPL family transporter [Deltaproteobacteria bacterium]